MKKHTCKPSIPMTNDRVLDNIMLGRHVHMRSGVLSSMIYWGRAQREEIAHRKRCEEIIDFLRIEHIRKAPVGKLPYGLQKRVELGRGHRALLCDAARRSVLLGRQRAGSVGLGRYGLAPVAQPGRCAR